MQMIKVKFHKSDGAVVEVAGQQVDVLDVGEDCVLAECGLDQLKKETTAGFPDRLHLQVHNEDGFGTFFFHELVLSRADDGVSLQFRCHAPNKYWEGRFGLATFITGMQDQVRHLDDWKSADVEVEDDWKGITLERSLAKGAPLYEGIMNAAKELQGLLHTTEVALAGFQWKPKYTSDEDAFCRELLLPLLREMGFVSVRYSHGKKEYGKDFTFSEATPFANYRRYGLQAKAGDVRGGVNSEIDELLGQIEDAFSMPYCEIGSKEPRYISTFIIAISGSFTDNAREKIVEKMPKGAIGSVYFLDRERLTELIDRYWKK